MTDSEKKKAAEAFAKKWLANEGSEKQDTHPFWIDLLHDVFGVTRATDYIETVTSCFYCGSHEPC